MFLLLGCEKSKTSTDPIALARIAADKLPRVVTIEPYGLEARVPGDWKCEREPNDGPTTCSGPSGAAHWSFAPPNPREPYVEERARKLEAESRSAGGSSSLHYGGATVAGIDGFVVGNRGRERRGDWIEFFGRKDVPGHGWLLLTVHVEGDEKDQRTLLAIAMSTKVGPSGIADSWSGEKELRARYDAEPDYATLSNDQAEDRWLRAARALAQKSPTGRRAANVDGGEEAVRKLIVRRVSELAAKEPGALLLAGGEGSKAATAARLAALLRGWDDAACDAALDVVEQAIVTAHRERQPHEARVLATTSGFLAVAEARASNEKARVATWTRMRTVLANEPPEIFTTRLGAGELRSVLLTKDPDMIAWVAERIARSKMDEAFEHGRISELFADAQVRAHPLAKKRLASVLALKTPYGSAKRDGDSIIIDWPGGSFRTTRLDSSGPDGTSVTMRVCDHYARCLPLRMKGKASTAFNVHASDAERDAWIAAWLRDE